MKITLKLNLKKSADLEIARKVMGYEIEDLEEKIKETVDENKAQSAEKTTQPAFKILKKAEKPQEEVRQITIEEVREQLSKVVADHKDACKEKLEALGASSVSTLNPDSYGEFYSFLKSLEK